MKQIDTQLPNRSFFCTSDSKEISPINAWCPSLVYKGPVYKFGPASVSMRHVTMFMLCACGPIFTYVLNFILMDRATSVCYACSGKISSKGKRYDVANSRCWEWSEHSVQQKRYLVILPPIVSPYCQRRRVEECNSVIAWQNLRSQFIELSRRYGWCTEMTVAAVKFLIFRDEFPG